MKNVKQLNETTNSSVYKKLFARKLESDSGQCRLCGPYSGCNSCNRWNPDNNWKKHRKTQWRE